MRLFFWLAIVAVSGYLIYELFYGALLFINPVKIEYQHIKGARVDIYARDITRLESFYYEIESDMAEAEEFTGLKFTEKPLIFVAQDEKEFARFVPWIRNNKELGSVSLLVSNLIYINSDKIKRDKYSEHEVFRHELIHNLITQNSVLITNIVINNQQWFSEGMATYFGGPRYLSELQFMQEINEKKPDYDMTNSKLFVNLTDDVKFNYTLYKFFIKYLIETYGNEKVRTFTARYVEAPTNFYVIYYEVFDDKMSVTLAEFMNSYKRINDSMIE